MWKIERRARTPANIASVAHSVKENPGLSILRHSLELGISQTTLHWILWPELEDMDGDNVYLQKKRWYVPHKSRNHRSFARKFSGRVISQRPIEGSDAITAKARGLGGAGGDTQR